MNLNFRLNNSKTTIAENKAFNWRRRLLKRLESGETVSIAVTSIDSNLRCFLSLSNLFLIASYCFRW
jgi:hypothetical protein